MRARMLLERVCATPCGLKPVPKGHFRKRELALGRKEEREHTTNVSTADRIAKQHLDKTPDYYTRLKKYVEPKAEKTRPKAALSLMALPQSSSAPSSP